jgi:hypothetical protein
LSGDRRVTSTYVSYLAVTRDMTQSLGRVEKQPIAARETAYYMENIGTVKSVEDFLADDRLYRYAMKAHGLEDMIYAKAFMRKALTEGITDTNSFANKLTDKRYRDFVASFNFVALGEDATSYVKAQAGTTKNYMLQAELAGVPATNPQVQADTAFYLANITKVKSIDQFMGDNRLYSYAMRAYGLSEMIDDKATMRTMLEGGVRDAESPANVKKDARIIAFVTAFNFEAYGENTTTYNASQRPAVDKYMRQTLEEDAGSQNEGVRLALYFERKSGDLKDFYGVLADPALAKVVRTALALPDSFATSDVDRQVKFFASKIDIEDFADPEKLGKFLQRFTAMWELQNPSAPAANFATVLFSQPATIGISTDALLALQRLKL